MSDFPDRPARPWDLFNKNIGRVSDIVHDERMEICRNCEFFIKLSGQCKKCGCIMDAKTRLPNAECPEHKWGQVDTTNVSYKEDLDK